MPIKMMISCLLNVEKIWNSAQINWSSTLNFYREYFFGRNNIHREIDRWSRHRFGAKWNVTVPNSVMPVKPLVCKLICTCHYMGNVVKWHTNYTYIKFSSAFSGNCDFEQFLWIHNEKCSICYRLRQQELKVSHEISIFRSMFMSHKYW